MLRIPLSSSLIASSARSTTRPPRALRRKIAPDSGFWTLLPRGRGRNGRECFLFRLEASPSQIFNTIRLPFSAQFVPDGRARHATRATKEIEIPILYYSDYLSAPVEVNTVKTTHIAVLICCFVCVTLAPCGTSLPEPTVPYQYAMVSKNCGMGGQKVVDKTAYPFS